MLVTAVAEETTLMAANEISIEPEQLADDAPLILRWTVDDSTVTTEELAAIVREALPKHAFATFGAEMVGPGTVVADSEGNPSPKYDSTTLSFEVAIDQESVPPAVEVDLRPIESAMEAFEYQDTGDLPWRIRFPMNRIIEAVNKDLRKRGVPRDAIIVDRSDRVWAKLCIAWLRRYKHPRAPLTYQVAHWTVTGEAKPITLVWVSVRSLTYTFHIRNDPDDVAIRTTRRALKRPDREEVLDTSGEWFSISL